MIIKLCSIAAVARNNVIGYENRIPWKIPSDLKWFKELTTNHCIIMGRNTWDSLPKAPLPNRYNIVVTNNPTDIISNESNVVACNSIERAWHIALFETRRRRLEKAFVIGGASLYNAFWPLIDQHYITTVAADVEGDTFYPNLSTDEFNCEPLGCEHANEDEFMTMRFNFTRKQNK